MWCSLLHPETMLTVMAHKGKTGPGESSPGVSVSPEEAGAPEEGLSWCPAAACSLRLNLPGKSSLLPPPATLINLKFNIF